MFCWLSSTSSSTFYVPMMESQWDAMTTTRGFPLPLLRNLSIHLVVPRNTPNITPRDDAAEEDVFLFVKKRYFKDLFEGFSRDSNELVYKIIFFTIFFVVVAVALRRPGMEKVQCVLSSKNMTTTTTEERDFQLYKIFRLSINFLTFSICYLLRERSAKISRTFYLLLLSVILQNIKSLSTKQERCRGPVNSDAVDRREWIYHGFKLLATPSP